MPEAVAGSMFCSMGPQAISVLVERDAQGYLLDARQWSEAVAERVARECGLPALTERHWVVISAMRRGFVERGSSPWLRTLTRLSGVSVQELYELFPRAPSRLVATIAGIPKRRACI